MSAPAAWPADWWASAREQACNAWRGVEAQHLVATMRLADTLAEQLALEAILEGSKPGRVDPGQHPLLAAPFRYRAPTPSRFRRAGAAGVWYGADTLHTAAAEVAYWRWRFLVASDGLRETALLTEHTFFCASVQGLAIDLTAPPWNADAARWQHPDDYGATHALADAAQAQGLQWLRYASARAPGGLCVAVFTAGTLRTLDPASLQTWHCKATRRHVMLVHGAARHEWRFGDDGDEDPPPATASAPAVRGRSASGSH